MKKINEKKEALIKKIHDVNFEVFEKVHDGVAYGDLIGFDDVYYSKAMKYVPNHILKKWIRDCKKEIKEHKEPKGKLDMVKVIQANNKQLTKGKQ